ncbi:MMPL family transporter [Paenibacillus guangzhouensis]|uniref:MMPL family transporter n=1 Tax=Paenibacillus guangzhouensis TaxID=1473112 RepID=UPI001267737F|nr:MMPL family transporter [Paenibacillus guangzhouensis]
MGIRGFIGWVSGSKGRWITLILWVIVVALLSFLWPAVNSKEANNAPNLADSKPSVQAQMIAEREFPSGADIPALLVWQRSDGLTQKDLLQLQQLTKRWESSPVLHQTSVIPLHKFPLPALQSLLSEDKTTIVVSVLFDKAADADQLKEGVTQLKEQATAEFGINPFNEAKDSALLARVTGPVGISIDATGLFSNADVSLLIATVLLVLIILLVIYRSPILALIPIIAVGFAYGVASPILGFMAAQGWITVDAQAISIMTVLLFGAGTDYCLFLISHYRHLLQEEQDKRKALICALKGSSGAIAMSGFTVVLSLLVLLVAEYGAYQRFAVPFSLSILIMGISSVTLVPALLAIFGRASFYPFVPRTPEMQAELVRKKGRAVRTTPRASKNRIGHAVIKRPWTIIAVTVMVLGGLAAYASQITFTYDILSSFPSKMESREGFAIIGDKFTEGELAPVQVLADTEGKTTTLYKDLTSLPYVDTVSEAKQGRENRNITAYEVTLKMNPYSLEAMEHIPDLHAVAEQSLAAAGIAQTEEKVWIGGQTATQYDTKVTGDRDTAVVLPIVIGLISILLLVYLRSVTAMLYLIATVVLSYFSALGLGWIILHVGFGVDAIQGAIPLYAFVFLVALGEDYNIFMVSRIWQKRHKMSLKQAIAEGVGETGSVITSAGLILAGTFAVLATLPIQVLVQFGTVTAVGVLLDTFIVRPFLVPAITAVFGKAAFWPAKLSDVEIRTEDFEAVNQS